MACARAASMLPPEQRIAAAYAIWFAVVDVISGVVMPHVPDFFYINCTDNMNTMGGYMRSAEIVHEGKVIPPPHIPPPTESFRSNRIVFFPALAK